MIINYADHSSNERTFLAWVRTAIAIVGFGLAASRLGDGASFWPDLALIVSGALVVGLAYLRMRHIRKRISDNQQFDDDSAVADGLLVLLVVALFALLGVFAFHVT